MSYTESQINDRINAVKNRYTNFVDIKFDKIDTDDLFLIAIDRQKQNHYIRFKSNGRLFCHRDGKWIIVNSFIYKES